MIHLLRYRDNNANQTRQPSCVPMIVLEDRFRTMVVCGRASLFLSVGFDVPESRPDLKFS